MQKNKFFSKKISSNITLLIFSLLLLLSLYSCSVPFLPEVPPSSYSTDAAINVLSSKYNVLETGYINGFGDIFLGEGKYVLLEGINGILMIFRHDDNDQAREKWLAFTKRYGNPFKMKYIKINMVNYGVFTIRLDKTDIYSWFKENWLIVVAGNEVDAFVQDINRIYKSIKIR